MKGNGVHCCSISVTGQVCKHDWLTSHADLPAAYSGRHHCRRSTASIWPVMKPPQDELRMADRPGCAPVAGLGARALPLGLLTTRPGSPALVSDRCSLHPGDLCRPSCCRGVSSGICWDHLEAAADDIAAATVDHSCTVTIPRAQAPGSAGRGRWAGGSRSCRGLCRCRLVAIPA